MNVILGCQNALSSASRLHAFRQKANKLTMPVLALLALLCGMGVSVHAQSTAYYAGITTSVSTGYLTDAEGMATDAAGNLYVAGTNGTTATVYEIARTGVDTYSTATPVALPTPASGYCASVTAPCLRGIAFDSAGHLWVAAFNGGAAGQVYELTPTAGSFTSSTPQPIGTGWVSPWGIAADKSGDVFVTDNTPNTVTEITGGTATVVNTGGVTGPRGIAVDTIGNLFVVNGNSSQVQELVAPAYTTVNTVSSGISGAGDDAFDANGNLWVSAYGSNSATELSGWDTVTNTFGVVNNWGSGLVGPVAVWPSFDGTMIVSDTGAPNGDGAINQINFQQPLNFASTALGASSTTQTLTFAFTASTTIGAPLVVSQGAAGKDFVNAGTGTCAAGTYAANATCTIVVTFAPKSPGSRAGAVELVDGSNAMLAEASLSGTATGPEVVFSPNLGNTSFATLASPGVPQKIVADGNNNIFVVDSNLGKIFEIPALGGAPVQIATTYSGTPYGIAIDGAGNLFVGNTNADTVSEILAPAYATIIGLPHVFAGSPAGLAVDASGNLYVAESPGGGSAAVEEATAVSGYSQIITFTSSLTNPFGVAVDASGDVFVADNKAGGSITEFSAGAAIGAFGSFTDPTDVAVDAAGNLYVSDTTGVTELTKASSYATAVTLFTSSNAPAAVALDNSGNVYYSTNASDDAVYEIQLASPGSLSFGTTNPYKTASAPQSVTVSNNGNADLDFSSVTATPTDFAAVSSPGDCLVGTPVTSSNSCLFAITFTPQSVGTLVSGTATLTDNAIPPTQTVSLTGTGAQAPTTVTWTPATFSIAYGTTLAGVLPATASCGTTCGTFSYTASGVGAVNSTTVLGVAGSPYTLTATFTLTDTTDYTPPTNTQAQVQVTVTKGTTTISTLPTASAITYGQTLASSNLTGGSVVSGSTSVPGTFAWTTPTTTPGAGTQSEGVTFTPTDTADYATVTGTVSVVVNKATTTIATLPTATAITYGQTLASSTLTGGSVVSGTTSVPGTFAWTTPTTTPGAGTQSEGVTFTPTDTADYATVTGTVSVVVNKATTTVSTLPTASAITYGQTLASSTLTGGTVVNGTTSVPGTFAWTTPTTAPTVGTQSEGVTFTPTDTADYSPVTGTVSVVVNKATTTVATLPTASAITYGQTLASSILTGGSVVSGTTPVPGTFAWTAPTTAPAAGTQSESVTFTPTDTADYSPVTGTVSVVVNKATTTIATLPTASAITYGQTLTSSILTGGTVVSGTTAVPGTFAFTAPTTAPTAGTHAEGVTFTPTDLADYNPVTGSVNVLVNQATTTITWHAPAAIPYGTPLSATQLDATASVGGTFTYTPVAGTILPVGAGQTLSVSFTPTDTTDYKTSTATTTITVTASALTVSANNATRVYGTANPAFTGTVTGAQGSDTFTESFTTPATMTSNAGTYPIVPSASGTNLADYTVVINNGTLTITKANSTTALSAGGSSANPGASVTLTATVTSATSGTPTGTVTFYNGTTMLGTGTLVGGVATYSTTTLAAGASNTLTAVYGGDINFNGSNSTSTVITVGVLDFTLGTPTPATQTGNAGTAFTYSFSISPVYGSYAGTVNFAATGLPSGAVATFSPSTIPANGGPQTETMIVNTLGGSAALVRPATPGRGLIPVALAFLFLPLAGTKRMRREGRRFGRMACLLLLVLAGLGATAAITGCGSNAGSGTNGQSYTITITATSGSIQHTSTVTLDLQQ